VREGSLNSKHAAAAAATAVSAAVNARLPDLRDYAMPIYDGDLEARDGPPAAAKALKAELARNAAVFIACPECNASITPLMKNTRDWVSRVRGDGEEPLRVFRTRVFAIGAASPGGYGGMRSLLALRSVLEIGLGALVIPEQIAVANAGRAFGDDDALKDDRVRGLLTRVIERLVGTAGRLAA
jgi:chromate reductase